MAPQRGEQAALRRIDGRVRRDASLPRAHECEVAVAGVGVRRREIVAAGLAEGREQATELRGRRPAPADLMLGLEDDHAGAQAIEGQRGKEVDVRALHVDDQNVHHAAVAAHEVLEAEALDLDLLDGNFAAE